MKLGRKEREMEKEARGYLETAREEFLERAFALENLFYSGFYVQCIESTAADGYEMFFEDHSAANFFRENISLLDERGAQRFYKLAGIHHTIRVLRRRKKELRWEEMKEEMRRVYQLDEAEMEMAEILYRCACLYQNRFPDLFSRTTARYLFHLTWLTPFLLAFLMNFWYNSYSSFMASYTGYVPFHIRRKRVTAG